jgi:hypothetical protein
MYTKIYVVLLLDNQKNNFFVVTRTNLMPTFASFWNLTHWRCRITDICCERFQKKVDLICTAAEA